MKPAAYAKHVFHCNSDEDDDLVMTNWESPVYSSGVHKGVDEQAVKKKEMVKHTEQVKKEPLVTHASVKKDPDHSQKSDSKKSRCCILI